MKERYIRAFGNSYECNSPNHERLWTIFRDECQRNDILYRPDDVFGYMHQFEMKEQQLSLFAECD